MLKDVMVRLDGSPADDGPLAAAAMIAELFQGHVTGLFLNLLPLTMPVEGDDIGAIEAVERIDRTREIGDRIEATLIERLSRLPCPAEVRRRDVFAAEIADTATREARLADTFITVRPNTQGAPPETHRVVESVLFGSGRHILLVPQREWTADGFERAVVGWNASRESVRALTEALPYLRKARTVTVVVVDDDSLTGWATVSGKAAIKHLKHHGIEASLHEVKSRGGDVAAALMEEAQRSGAQLLVMGGYGHSRLREWLLGGVTYDLLHHAAIPLLIAH
ncbi:universal stress protein [Microvirga sp. 2TAF3]|uniref:universal stress protein n=1 Tax=Microvirga sp. 2TAF3 TaxID=3233014 RepID=UPI003F94ECE9